MSKAVSVVSGHESQRPRTSGCAWLAGCDVKWLSLGLDGIVVIKARKLKNVIPTTTRTISQTIYRWGLLMWEIGRWRPPACPDRGTPSRVDKRVAPDREGATDKQCQGEGKLLSQYVITNHKEGKGKPPWLFPKTGYPLGYPEPALQQKTEEGEIYRAAAFTTWCS